MPKWSHKCWELISDNGEDLTLKPRPDFVRCFWGRAFVLQDEKFEAEYECVKGFREKLCELLLDLNISFFPSEDFVCSKNGECFFEDEMLVRRITDSKLGISMDNREMIWRQVINRLSSAPLRIFEIPKSKKVITDLKPNVFVEWGYALAKENLEHIVVVNENIEDVPFPSDLSNTFQIRGKDADTLVKNIAEHLENSHHSIFCANERFVELWHKSEKHEKEIWRFLLNSGNSEKYFSVGDIAQHLCECAKDNLPDANAKVYAFLGKYEEFIERGCKPDDVRVYQDYAVALRNFINSNVKRLPNASIDKN